MNREIEIVNGKLYVPMPGTIYVLTFAEAEELAKQLLAAIRPTPLGANTDDPNAECPVCGQPTGWINAPRRSSTS